VKPTNSNTLKSTRNSKQGNLCGYLNDSNKLKNCDPLAKANSINSQWKIEQSESIARVIPGQRIIKENRKYKERKKQ
jgi:hypothetical protein